MTSPQYYFRTVLVDTREHILISNLGIFQQRMSPGSGAFSLAFNFPAMHYQICIIGKCLYSFKRDDSCLKIWTKPQSKNAKIHFQLTCIVQKQLYLRSQLSIKDIKRENLIKQRHPTCIKKVKMSPV